MNKKIKMTWPVVVIAAVVVGVLIGLIMVPKCLVGTSFRQAGINIEFWIFAAMIVISGCEKPLEAGIKTFVFFLISQPLIYLVQVPFASLGWHIFDYYPRWGIITLLTLPGGVLAWYVRKDNLLSVLIISVANGLLCMMLAQYMPILMHEFPRLLVACIFIAVQIVVYCLVFFKNRRNRILVTVIAVLLLIVMCFYYERQQEELRNEYSTTLEGTAPFEVVGEYDGIDISIDGNTITINADYYYSIPIDVKDADGNIVTYDYNYGENGTSLTAR